MTKSVLGVIGGSGVYDMAMDDSHWVAIASPGFPVSWGPKWAVAAGNP